jgi:[acyl-carrier-protein] S-malonyltransferase
MAALLGLDVADVIEIAAEAAAGEVCEAANDNAAGQVVVSGHKAAVARAIEIAKRKGAKRAVLLPVSAPFHCALMEPAARVMADALDRVKMHKPNVPLIANVTAEPLSEPRDIRDSLVRQVTEMVRWRETVATMAAHGVNVFCELGAGKVLTGLVRRNAPAAKAVPMGTPDEIAAALISMKDEAHVI